jgi:hypothetical protein
MPSLNGCPSTDIDNDGIPNDVDKCPNEAETYNGKVDDDGCPETKGADAKAKPLVTVAEQKGVSRVVLRSRLAFDTSKDGTSSKLAPGSEATVRAVAALLLQNPTWKLTVAIKQPVKETASRADLVVAKIRGLVGRDVVAKQDFPAKKGDPSGVSLIVTK